MTKLPVTIILLPDAGDPLGLLAPGVGGSRPPTMTYVTCRKNCEPGIWWLEGATEAHSCPHCTKRLRVVSHRVALLLAHSGQPVRAGCDACDWALEQRKKGTPMRGTQQSVEGALLTGELKHLQYHVAGRLSIHHAPIGTVLVLDSEGTEVSND